MTKPKLAICVTGQIRHFRKHQDRFYEGLDNMFGDKFDYDLYGHTWDDQVLPDISKFERVSVTDQRDWWKYLVESSNPFGAMIVTEKTRNHLDYQKAINGKGDLLSVMEQVITGRWAQLLTTHHAFTAIPEDKREEYIAFVRFRWDATDSNTNDKTLVRKWKQQYYNLVVECYKNNTNAVITNPSEEDLFEDFMITFSQQAYGSFIDESANDTMNSMIKDNYAIGHSHDLWENFCKFKNLQIITMEGLNPIGFLETEWVNEKWWWDAKSNKQWGV